MSEGQTEELEAFLEQYPETRFMDTFAADISGVLRGKRVQADEMSKFFGGKSNYCAATLILNVMGDSAESVVYGTQDGDPDIRCKAVAGSLAPVPWAALPTAQCLLETMTFEGKPHVLDPRNVLRTALKPLQDMGLKPVMATELEFFLVEHDGTSFKPRLPRIPGSDLEQIGTQFAVFSDLDEVEPFLTDLDAFCKAQNIPAGAALSEYSPGQFEVNLNHINDPILAADHAILLKRAVKAAARKNGLAATFMAKPFQEFSGSGLHIHISLLQEDGSNIFSGSSTDGDFSDTLRHAIGGVGEVMPESMAIFAPNANSYRRYAPGCFTPASANWGPNNRDLAIRIPVSGQKNRRFEHRVAGADANPYLVIAAIMAGIHHGISNRIEPEPMIPEHSKTEYKPTLPQNWPAALDIFEAGKILPKYLGAEYHRVYGKCKREEYAIFNAQITNRDYEWYLRAV